MCIRDSVVAASGNSNQKQTTSDHADYDNFFHTTQSERITDGNTFTQFGYAVYPTTNRPGFPQQAGKYTQAGNTYSITMTAPSSSVYSLSGNDRNGSVSGNNVTITIKCGDTLTLNVNASGHPVYLKEVGGTGTGDQVRVPTASNQGTQSGQLTWTPTQAGTYYYNCQYHSAMQGTITVQQGTVVYPVINVGALDDQYGSGTVERKVTYSDMGNRIDLYAPADGSVGATVNFYGTDIPRYDSTYSSKSGNTTWSDGQTGSPNTSSDTRFSGTSSACPVAAGLIATVVQYNRSWTWSDVKTWLATLQNKTGSDFYIGTEDTGPDDAGHADVNKIQGSTPRVIYQGGTFSHTTKETTTKDVTFGQGINITGSLGMTRD